MGCFEISLGNGDTIGVGTPGNGVRWLYFLILH
jgi:hypothetical protein